MPKRTTVDPEQLADTTKLEESLVVLIQNIKKYIIPAIILIVVLMVVAMVLSKQKEASATASAEAFAALSEAMELNLPQEATEAQEEAAYKGRLVKLDEVIATYPESQVSLQAEFYKAKTYYTLEDYAKAIEAFGDFAQKHPSAKPFTALAIMGKGNAQTETDDLEGALETFLSMSKLGAAAAEVPLLAQAKYRAAICAAVLGQKDQARSLLEEILASPADEFMKQRAQEALDNLDVLPATALQKIKEEAAETESATEAGSSEEAASGNLEIQSQDASAGD